MDKRWLTVRELADYIGYSQRSIYRFVTERRIPYYQPGPGRSLLFDRGEVDAWIASHRHEAFS